jgi:hypothetical protein
MRPSQLCSTRVNRSTTSWSTQPTLNPKAPRLLRNSNAQLPVGGIATDQPALWMPLALPVSGRDRTLTEPVAPEAMPSSPAPLRRPSVGSKDLDRHERHIVVREWASRVLHEPLQYG